MLPHGAGKASTSGETGMLRARAPSRRRRRGLIVAAMSDTIRTEALIVGGGMVGLSLAIALARAGIKTAVIDRDAADARTAEPFDGRASAIAQASRRILEGIGVWSDMAREAQPTRRNADNKNAPVAKSRRRRGVVMRGGVGCGRGAQRSRPTSHLREDGLVGLNLLDEVLRVVRLLGVEEAGELAEARRVTHFAQGFGLDLADAFAGDLELLADLFERAAVAVDEAEAEG